MKRSGVLNRRAFLAGLAGAGAATFLPWDIAQAQVTKPFSFAFVSDCHLITRVPDSFKLTQESQLFLQDAIKRINSLAPDFVIFGGDQVDAVGLDEVNWQLFVDVVQLLNCPWSFILGEKDVSGNVPVDKLRTFGRDWKGKGLPGDHSYWSQDVLPGVHLIGLDSSSANTTAGDLSSEQLAWLQADLDSNKHGIVIVASHHPLLPPAPYDGGPPWDDYVVSSGATAREILNSSRYVRLALSGHVYVSKIERERDIWYVSSPGLDVFPCAFRFFRVDQNGITVETYQIDYPALIKKARTSLAASTLAFHYSNNHPATFLDVVEGTHLDQNAFLPFGKNGTIEAIKRHNPPKETKEVKETKQAKETKKADESKETAAPADNKEPKKKRRSFFGRKKEEPTPPPERPPNAKSHSESTGQEEPNLDDAKKPEASSDADKGVPDQNSEGDKP